MAAKLKLGIIGMSEGNGHPYSWSAIFNGFNFEYMKDCGFPVIPEYLSKETFPENFLTEIAEVTHVWSQDKEVSRKIARASLIGKIVSNPEEMIGAVDAVIIARDDAENHAKISAPFILAGTPVFIDKPFALSVNDALKMFKMKKYLGQIFTCSSLRFAKELMLNDKEKHLLGKIYFAEASVMKSWDKYAIHILEPTICQIPERGDKIQVKTIKKGELTKTLIEWENFTMYLKTTGTIKVPLAITFYGESKSITKTFIDSFSAFKNSLYQFIKQVKTREQLIPESETLELVEIIEEVRK